MLLTLHDKVLIYIHDSIAGDPSSQRKSLWMKARITFCVAASTRIILKVGRHHHHRAWLFVNIMYVGFCDGTHRKEEGIRKYNEFLLKANNKLKEENEALKVTILLLRLWSY